MDSPKCSAIAGLGSGKQSLGGFFFFYDFTLQAGIQASVGYAAACGCPFGILQLPRTTTKKHRWMLKMWLFNSAAPCGASPTSIGPPPNTEGLTPSKTDKRNSLISRRPRHVSVLLCKLEIMSQLVRFQNTSRRLLSRSTGWRLPRVSSANVVDRPEQADWFVPFFFFCAVSALVLQNS